MSEENLTTDQVENTESGVQESTTVEEVNIDIDEMFGQPGADSVMLPEEEEEKNTVFSKPKDIDTTFIDKPVESPEEGANVESSAETKESTEDTIDELNSMISGDLLWHTHIITKFVSKTLLKKRKKFAPSEALASPI